MYELIRKSKIGKAVKEVYTDGETWEAIGSVTPNKKFKNKKEILTLLRTLIDDLTKVSDWEDENYIYTAKKVGE